MGRANDWISGKGSDSNDAYLTLGSLPQSIQEFESGKNVFAVVDLTLFNLKKTARLGEFKHFEMQERWRKVQTTALRSFEHDLFESIRDFAPHNVSLAELILPSAETLPSMIHALRTPDATITKFFQAKGLPDFTEQTYYLFEMAFHHHLSTMATQRTDAQDLTVSISNPAEWYPVARRLKRKLILHVGPTNSGKTYNALERLRESNNGLYAGPLRLLAREVYHRFKSDGIRCNLITGEEVIHDLDAFGQKAPLSCSTVEMVDLNTEFEVAVIDEIQMIGDTQRGWAWTNALMGVRAHEVHLCGEASIVELVQKIAKFTGDDVIVKEYTRLGELKVEDKPLKNHLSSLKRGDCVVVFSKKRILQYKAEIERLTGLKAGVIYGALPAETRTEQARKFNEGEYDVLVASDAIGMGLNLRIKRVIFDSHQKFNGNFMEQVAVPHVKQIAGRAGRFKVAPSSKGPSKLTDDDDNEDNVGYVTAFKNDTLKYVQKCMDSQTIPVNNAILWPSDEIWSHYVSEFPKERLLSVIIQEFKKEVEKSRIYQIADIRDRVEIVSVLENIQGMLLTDILRISTAPISTRLPEFAQVLYGFGLSVSRNLTKSCFDYEALNFGQLSQRVWDVNDLTHLEDLHKYLMVWLWMNNRYPELFVNRATAVDAKNLIEERIEETLSFKDAFAEKEPKKEDRRRRR